ASKSECDLTRAIGEIIKSRGPVRRALRRLQRAAIHLYGNLGEWHRAVRNMADHAATCGDPDSPLAILVDRIDVLACKRSCFTGIYGRNELAIDQNELLDLPVVGTDPKIALSIDHDGTGGLGVNIG